MIGLHLYLVFIHRALFLFKKLPYMIALSIIYGFYFTQHLIKKNYKKEVNKMAQVTIINPLDKSRLIPNTEINIDFTVGKFITNANNGSIVIKISPTKDFSSDVIIITPTKIYASLIGEEIFDLYSPNNTIGKNDVDGKLFRVIYNFPNTRTVYYIKITFTENFSDFDSNIIMVSTLNTLEYSINPIIVTDRPSKVKFLDKKTVVEPENISYFVDVCNNALDEEPTWEDATEAYINKSFHIFQNKEKTSANWAIGIKYRAFKSNETSKLEINEVYIVHV